MGPPLAYALRGDYRDPDAFEESDYYRGYVSPDMVKDIASSLSHLPPLEIASLFEAAEAEFNEYYQRHFERLTRFYLQVAEAKDAIFILIY